MPWTWGSRDEDRAEVKKLSGTNEVPILVLDDGEVISGSGDDRPLGQGAPAGRQAAAKSVGQGAGGDQSRARAPGGGR